MSGLIASEYMCPEHGRFDALVERPAPDDSPCPSCGEVSSWCISAPMTRVRIAEVERGSVDKPASPMYLSTQDLGNGMPMEEWRAKRDKVYEERRHKEAKDFVR